MIIWTIAKTTIGDAMRKKILQIFLVVAIALIVMSLSFSQNLSFSSREGAGVDLMLVKSFGLGLMAIAGALISIVMGVSLIPQEIERRTIYTILSKPVKRYEFIIGKFLGAILTLAINIALMGLVFMAAVTIKASVSQIGAPPSLTADAASATALKGAADAAQATALKVGLFDVNTLLGVVMIFLQFMVLSSVVLFFSVFMTATVNFFMGTAVYIVGVMAALTETIANSPGSNPALKLLYQIIHIAVPNFDKFNVTNALLHPESVGLASLPMYTFKVAMYAVLYTLVMMTLAVLFFEKKEV